MPAFDQLTDDQIARLVYLVLILVSVGSYAVVATRGRILTFVRHLLLWGVVFVGAAAAYGLWDTLSLQTVAVETPNGDGLVLRRSFDGQYHLTLDVTGPNGAVTPVSFIVDTGASEMVLTQRDATKLGFDVAALNFLGVASTANGITRTAQVRLDRVALEGHQAENVRALVNEGELHGSLLGMGYLERFARIEITRDRLRIVY